MSQNVTMSIRRGGGACVVPPMETIGVLTWERMQSSGLEPASLTEELRIEFLAAPGKQIPEREIIPEEISVRGVFVPSEEAGPSCPLPQDTRLDGGEITASGPGWGPLRATPGQPNIYRLPMPPNTIRAGRVVVRGAGGRDVGPFETSMDLQEPIRPIDYPPGTRIPCCTFYGGRPHFAWTGGTDQSWLRIAILSRPERVDNGARRWERDLRASVGEHFLFVPEFSGIPPSRNADVLYTQEPVNPVRFEAPGLTRGGIHRFIYRWRFGGVVVRGVGVE